MKYKYGLRALRLAGLFTLLIFVIMLLTVIITFSSMIFLHRTGVFDARHPLLPVFVFAIASLIIGTVIATLFSIYNLKPLKQIMDATDRIAEGDYSPRIQMGGPKELKELSSKFNHMAQELGSVEMLRTDFVNNFSHEFKTPIVSIRGFAKLLKSSDLTEEEHNDYLDTIICESERLADLSTNVLNLSRLEQQTILTGKKRFNVSEQIRLVIALMDSKWRSKHIGFDFDCDCDEKYLIGNEELLKQLWINLLDNAVKFSPENGTVGIHITRISSGLVFAISNAGEGISEDAIPYIFDKFYQENHSHTLAGNGLGLAIAKRIVLLHGGEITACSVNGETTFTVTLPRK